MTLMATKVTCDELTRLNRAAASAFLAAKRIRLSRDVSIFEDAELCREWDRKIYAVIRHLLVGHDGNACPAGDRPIAKASKREVRLSRL